MKKVIVGISHENFLKKENIKPINFTKEDYEKRIALLLDSLIKNNLDYCFIYSDREHFSNLEYFTGFDSRFEESVFILKNDGTKNIILGNECMNYSEKIPFEVNRHLFQNFSLQGQIKDKLVDFKSILKEIGLTKNKKIGVICTKYFESNEFGDPKYIFDIPHYLIDNLREVCSTENVMNYTHLVTGLPDGIRMVLRSAKEIAWAEASSTICANTIIDLLKNLELGISSRELSMKAIRAMDPLPVHPMINFGTKNVALGLSSPDDTVLKLGDVCGLCYSLRGGLTSRVGVASYDFDSVQEELKNYLFDFYGKHFIAMANWYEAIEINCLGGKLHDAVHKTNGIESNGIYLNCGHNIGTDEWSNSPSYKNSLIPILSGSHMQVDIISSKNDPVLVSICEDGIIIADKELREELKNNFRDVYDRIILRQKLMREILNINIKDEILPLSNLNAVMFPFMLNLNNIFRLEK